MLEASLLLLAAIIYMAVTTPPQKPGLAIAGGLQIEPPPDDEPKAWESTLMFKKGGGGSAPSPDPNIGKAAMKEAETGEDWLEFAKQQFDVGNERQNKMDALTNQVTEAQLQSMNDSNARATEQWDRYKNVYQPVEDEYVKEATNWGSADRENQQAAEAKQDVLTNAASQKQQQQRSMASMGVNPTSGRYAGVDNASSLSTALAAAGAQNTARNQTRTQALALKEGVANMGKGATANSAQQLGLGLNAGNSAVGNTSTANQNFLANNQTMTNGFQGAMSGYGNQASILNSQYSNQLAGWQAQQSANSASSAGLMSGLGQMAGTGAMMFAMSSSKDFKEDKRPTGSGLDAINSMPIEDWKYKDGIADGGQHTGAYAEDFQKATGKGDGKSIPVIDAIGVTMKAVQELSSKQDKTDKAIKSLAASLSGRSGKSKQGVFSA